MMNNARTVQTLERHLIEFSPHQFFTRSFMVTPTAFFPLHILLDSATIHLAGIFKSPAEVGGGTQINAKTLKKTLWYPHPSCWVPATLSRWERDSPKHFAGCVRNSA
jgi:hypothetical protein